MSGAKQQRTAKTLIPKTIMQFAMVLVAGAVGIALHAEQNFTPLLSLFAAILAYIAFRSLHNLLHTAHKADGLLAGLAKPETMPDEAPVEISKDSVMPAARAFKKTAPVLRTSEHSDSTKAHAPPMRPTTMEMLKPSGRMSSDLIAQTLRHELPGPPDSADPKPATPGRTDAKAEPAETTAPHSARIINEIARELSTLRPGFDTQSVDCLARDLEAATRAMESELRAAVEDRPDRDAEPDENGADPDGAPQPTKSEATPAQRQIDADAEAAKPNLDTDKEPAPTDDAEPVAQGETSIEAEGEKTAPDATATVPATEPEQNAPDQDKTDETGLQNLIKEAISSCRAHIYLQPILGLATRKAESFEVLTHLENNRGEVLKPSEYIEEAERSGRMPAIDDAMFKRTISVLRKLQSSNAPGTMFCNLSIFSLSDDEVMNSLITTLKGDPQSAQRLVVELSEQAYLACTPGDREKLEHLRRLGVRLSMDQLTDAGIFMDALKSRIFSFIKVDTAFFLNKLGSDDDALMPAEILSEARLAGVDLVIEKIETSSDLEQVIEMGAKYGQGLIFSEPRPVKRELLEDAA